MNTMPSPRGMPSTTAPTITQPKPASAYGSQARATQLGTAFMTPGYKDQGATSTTVRVRTEARVANEVPR